MPCHRCGAPEKRRKKHQRPQKRPLLSSSSDEASDEGPQANFYRRRKEFMSLDGENAMREPDAHASAKSSVVASPSHKGKFQRTQSGNQDSACTDEAMSGFETTATVKKNKVTKPHDLSWLYQPVKYPGDSNLESEPKVRKEGTDEVSFSGVSRLPSQTLHEDSGGSGAHRRTKLSGPRTVDHADHLTERGANPRTGMISPSIASANSSDKRSHSNESLPSNSTKWRQRGDQWISMESNQKTPSPPPNTEAPKRDGLSKSKPIPIDPPGSIPSPRIPHQTKEDRHFLGEEGANTRKEIPRNILVVMRHVCHSSPKSAPMTSIISPLPTQCHCHADLTH